MSKWEKLINRLYDLDPSFYNSQAFSVEETLYSFGKTCC